MVIIIIFCSFVIYKINCSLIILERRQEALCYDMTTLTKKIREEELALLKY